MNGWFQAPGFARKLAIAALVGVVGLRLVAVFMTRDDVVFRVPYLDAAFYRFWALSLASGRGDFADAYFLGPMYPHFLSWLFRIGLSDPLAVRLVQTMLGVLDIALVLQLGRRLHASSTGVFAALLFGLHGTVFFYEGLLVMESLLTTLILCAWALLLLPSGSNSRRVAALLGAGLLLGAATAGRGTVLLLLPVALSVIWRPSRGPGSHPSGWPATTLLLTAWFVPLLPVLAHNAERGAPWTLTTNAGVNFHAGNNADSRGRFRPPPGMAFFTRVPQTPDGGRLPPGLAQRQLTTEAVAGSPQAADSAEWMRRSLRWIGAEPLRFGELLLRKVGLVLQGREIGQIESPSFQRQRLPWLRVFPVGWSVLLPLALLGWWLGRRHVVSRRSAMVWGSLVVLLLLPCVLFFVTARYRLVAVPFASLLAGMGVTFLVGLWRHQRRLFWRWFAVLVVLWVGTRIGARPPASAAGWENAQMAERTYAAGDLRKAIHYQETAVRHLPDRPEIRLNLALYWSERAEMGDLPRAEALLRQLAQERPTDVIVLFNWASLLEQTGNPVLARRMYRRVLEIDPDFEAARRNLRILEDRQRTKPRTHSEDDAGDGRKR